MEKKPFYDLIYGPKEAEEVIKKKYPNAKITDASDYIHTERFECTIEGTTDEEFYPFAIKEGFASCCFTISLLLESLKFPELKEGPKHKDTKEKLDRWIRLSEEVSNGTNRDQEEDIEEREFLGEVPTWMDQEL